MGYRTVDAMKRAALKISLLSLKQDTKVDWPS
jgi:hypothetical protein